MLLKQDGLSNQQFQSLLAFLADDEKNVIRMLHPAYGFCELSGDSRISLGSAINFANLVRSENKTSGQNVVIEVLLSFDLESASEHCGEYAVPNRYFLDLIHILQGNVARLSEEPVGGPLPRFS